MSRGPRSVLLALLLVGSTVLAGCTQLRDWLEPGAKTGEPAPDFTMVDLEGRTHNLSDYRGRVVVLDFMASSCGPCRVQMPHLLDWNRTDPDLVILSVSVDPTETRESLTAFRDEFGARWPFARDEDLSLREPYGVLTLPKIVVVDPEGRIAFASRAGEAVGEDELSDAIRHAKGAVA